MTSNVALSATWFKHPAFISEREWRIVISVPPSGRDVFFRPSSRTVIPYVKTQAQPDEKLPVVSVTIGPTLDQNLSYLSVHALLASKGYLKDDDDDVEIKISEIPLTRTD